MQKTAIDLLGFVFADQTNAEQHTQQEGQAKKVEQAASEAEQSHRLARMLAATTSANNDVQHQAVDMRFCSQLNLALKYFRTARTHIKMII